MTDSDEQRDLPSRPQYGEYATPEQQRAHIRDAQSMSTEVPLDPPIPAPDQVPPVTQGAAPAARKRPVDRFVSILLLAFGLWNVVGSIPQVIDYAAYVEQVGEVLRVDITLSDPAAARVWGIAAAVTLGLGWLLTLTLVWRNVRAGRLAWWVAVVGGVVFSLIAGGMLAVPLLTDPAVLDAVLGSQGTATP